jgi:hypothetical protein
MIQVELQPDDRGTGVADVQRLDLQLAAVWPVRPARHVDDVVRV